MRGRIYDPLAGRFTSADPIMQAPFHTQGLNRYSYVFNDPINAVDPSGFSSIEVDFILHGVESVSGGASTVSNAGAAASTVGTAGAVSSGAAAGVAPIIGGALSIMKTLSMAGGTPGSTTTGSGPVPSAAPATQDSAKSSSALQQNSGGVGPNADVSHRLPDSGPGYGSKPGSVKQGRHWGTRALVEGIQEVGRRWQKANPGGPKFYVGDMSKEGGGHITPHKAHDKGVEVDIAALPTSGEGYRVVQVGDVNYSRKLTSGLIKQFDDVFGDSLDVVFFADSQTGINKVVSSTATGKAHTWHFHIRIKL